MQSFLLIDTENLTVCWRTNNTPFTGNSYILGITSINKCAKRIDFNTLITGKNHRQIILNKSTKFQLCPLLNFKIDITLENNSPCFPFTTWYNHSSATIIRQLVYHILDIRSGKSTFLHLHHHLAVRKLRSLQLRHMEWCVNSSNSIGHKRWTDIVLGWYFDSMK